MAWHFRGTPPYLSAQGKRLGMVETLVARAKHNTEIHRVSIILGQLCERWHKARKEDDRPVYVKYEAEQVAAGLAQADQECAKLHALAGAAAAMIDEGYAAWGIERPDRGYAVMANNDAPTPSSTLENVRPNGAVVTVTKPKHV
jgi:hypothetical protein